MLFVHLLWEIHVLLSMHFDIPLYGIHNVLKYNHAKDSVSSEQEARPEICLQ